MKLRYLSLVFAGLIFTGCQSGGTELESVLPEHTMVAMAIDYSDENQRAAFDVLKVKFPETGMLEKAIIEYNAMVENEEDKYENLIEPIVKGEWKLLFGVTVGVGGEAFYVAGKFSEADAVENLITILLDGEAGVEVDGATTWTVEEEQSYIARYNDVFFMTNNEANRTAALERLKKGKGLEIEGQVDGNLGYMFVNTPVFMPFLTQMYQEMGAGEAADYMNMFGEIYMSVKAEEDGFRFLSETSLVGEAEKVAELFPDKDYQIFLVDKVPGEATILYMEQPSFDALVRSFAVGFSQDYSSLNVENFDEEGEIASELAPNLNAYSEIVGEVADFANLENEAVEEFFKAPFAISFGAVPGALPTFGVYLDVAGNKETAEALTLAIDDYLEEVLIELQGEIGEVEFLKNEVVSVKGGGMHKISVDWTQVPEEAKLEFAAIPAFGQAWELYYGVTGDDVFAVAFYPEFDQVYGSMVLSEDERFAEGIEKLGEGVGLSMTYFNFAPLMSLADQYVELYMTDADDKAIYEQVKKFVVTMKYIVGSSVFEGDDVLKSEAFIKVE